MSRRAFLGTTAVGASRVSGANDRIRCAIIGAGSRGYYLTEKFREEGAEIVAVCDVYEPRMLHGLQAASSEARGYTDYRRLLEDKSIDAVIIATPDHWHAQMLIDAVQADKDAYLEKPFAHTAEEGFRMVDAVRRTDRVVLVGTQRRSYELYHEVKEIFRSGILGEIRLVNSWWLNYWGSLVQKELEGKLNWDLFLGPAPKRKLDAFRFFNWPGYWDYSGGILVAQAAHVVDAVHWMMDSTYPLAVNCSGGKVNLEGAEIPETCSMTVEYPENYLLVFTVGYKAMHYNAHNDQLIQFHGSKARLDLGRESWSVYPQSGAVDPRPSRERRSPRTFESASFAHMKKFLDCVRSRRDANATVEMGNSTNIVLSMAMRSLRLGRQSKWNRAARQIDG